MPKKKSKPIKVKKTLLLNINTGGRLGNHLYSYSWMIRISMLAGAVAVNPAFTPYKHWFEIPSSQQIPFWPSSVDSLSAKERLLLFPFSHRLLALYHHARIKYQLRLDELKRIEYFKHKLLDGLGYIAYDYLVSGRHAANHIGPTFALEDGTPDFYSKDVINYIKSKRLVLLDSAAISPSFALGIEDKLRTYFKPKKIYLCQSEVYIDKLRRNADIVVGISIRQGDFATWMGGTWFVEPSRFRALMELMSNQLSPRNCAFIICSDGQIDESIIADFSCIVIPPNPPLHLSLLMACDYIIGTKSSTFIEWSSFLGNVPFHAVSPDDFFNSMPLIFKVFGSSG